MSTTAPRPSPHPSRADLGRAATLDPTDRGQDAFRSETFASALIDHVSEHVVLLEAIRDERGAVCEWRYAAANDAALALLEMGREIVGKTIREVLGPERAQARHPTLVRVLETGKPERYETIFRDRTLLVTLFRVDDARVGSGSLDITEGKRRRAAESAVRSSEERFRRLVEVSSQIVWVADARGEVVEDSPSWRAFTGRSFEQWRGWAWLDAVHPDDRARLAAEWQASVEARTAHRVEFRQLHASGEYREMECRAVPVLDEDGAVREWVGMNVDVTERKRCEAALREVDRRKDEFLAMLSHELRNPLAPIRNAVAVLAEATTAGEQAARARAVIARQVAHLARLVDDLLDVTRIARGKFALRRERLDLVGLVQRAAEDHRPLLHERGVSVSMELPGSPTPVLGDAARLTQVLGILLQNAAKFTERGGRVTVSVGAAQGIAEVRVADTGVGIDPVLLERLFDRFVQGDQTLARSQGGLGLGLALVKAIAELHGGTVLAESAGPGRGACFVVRLPLAEGELPLRVEPASLPHGARRILVVDDNRDAADSLAELLRMLGHEVEVAYDGPGAVERARAGRPEVVLCDLGLPGMTGFEVARAIRALGDPPPRLVAVSGYARAEDVERARAAGFEDHVAKPPDPERLAQLLR